MEYLKPLIEKYNSAANPEKVEWMVNYMKGHFNFLGMNTKERRDITKRFYREYGLPDAENLFKVVSELWIQSHREYQYTAIELMRKCSKLIKLEDIDKIEELIITKSWWDSVDGLAAWVCGDYFKRFPGQVMPVTQKWMQSGNMWLQRSVLLYQLSYKTNTNTELLAKWIKELTDHKDFFIRKAIGWILREYSKTNPDWVLQFVKENDSLSGLSKKEALKHLERKKINSK